MHCNLMFLHKQKYVLYDQQQQMRWNMMNNMSLFHAHFLDGMFGEICSDLNHFSAYSWNY